MTDGKDKLHHDCIGQEGYLGGVKVKELESLIQFWKDSLAEHRLLMSPSTVYLVEQTIRSLEELKRIKDSHDQGESCKKK